MSSAANGGWDPWSFVPRQYNLGTALTTEQVRRGLGNQVALLWENARGQTRTLTYADLDEQSNRLARSLARLGIKSQDRVLLRLPNIPEFYLSALALAKLGAVFIPSSTQFRAGEVEYRLRDAGAVAVIVTSDLLEAVETSASRCPDLQHVIVVPYPDPEPVREPNLDFGQLIREAPPEGTWQSAQTQHDDVAFMAYTSGTTGDPKGVVHLQRYPCSYESVIRYWHDYRPGDIVACPSELGWMLPVACTFLYALEKGLTAVLYDPMGGRFDPLAWFRLLEKYRVTNFTAPPTVFRMLMASGADAKSFDLSAWRHAATAGEPLPADTFRGIQRHFGVTPLDGIGMSECMVYCFNRLDRPIRPGSCGTPAPGTVIELLDDELQPVPCGSEGILAVRRDTHPGMMREYWHKPERTREVFQGEWYLSGDVFIRDEDNYFWFQGRGDDVIKASGYRISPFEIESCLCSHPAVLESAAVGVDDELRGTVVKAFLVLRSGFDGNEELAKEIQEFVRREVAPYKYPRQIEFVTSLPKTTSGKIKRRLLREQK